MIEAHPLTAENIERIRPLYDDFGGTAISRYHWDTEPVDFDTFKMGITRKLVNGYLVEDSADEMPVAFMIYRNEEHRAIEINIVYVRPDITEYKNIMDRLMRRFTKDIADVPGWEAVSWPMLGDQDKLVRTISWYGLRPLGQAIMKFDIMDPVTLQILKQQNLTPLPEGYRLALWDNEYAGQTAVSIYESFSKAADALWDPRFKTEMGAKKVVAMLTAGEMGAFVPQGTSVLLKDDVPVGFCFLVQPSMPQGNIPLIGVRPSEKGKGKHLGSHLMKHSLDATIQAILDGKIGMYEITATLETDNYPAIKMYRRFGFRETVNYPHAYLSRETLKTAPVGHAF